MRVSFPVTSLQGATGSGRVESHVRIVPTLTCAWLASKQKAPVKVRGTGVPPLEKRFPPLDSSTEPQPPACWVSPIWKGKPFVIRRGLHHPTMHCSKSDKSPVSNAAEGEQGYDLPLLPTLTPPPPLISPRGSFPFSIRCLCPPSALSSLGSGLLSAHSFSFALRCGEGQRVSLIW